MTGSNDPGLKSAEAATPRARTLKKKTSQSRGYTKRVTAFAFTDILESRAKVETQRLPNSERTVKFGGPPECLVI